MIRFRNVLRESKTTLLQGFAARRVQSRLSTPIISFTFDDVPLSAYHHGVPLLDQFDVKATFYVCLGFRGDLASEHLGPREIQQLAKEGHDIGCHTFSHYRLSQGSVKGLLADAEENRNRLAQELGGMKSFGFSYPFGELSFAEKRGLEGHYKTLRSTRHGINSGSIDLNCLKAVPLYSGETTMSSIRGWLDLAHEKNGWILFYTHGVSDTPGQYDIGTQQFEEILGLCAERGWPLLPVSTAVQYVTG